jgi:hypothetical protein
MMCYGSSKHSAHSVRQGAVYCNARIMGQTVKPWKVDQVGCTPDGAPPPCPHQHPILCSGNTTTPDPIRSDGHPIQSNDLIIAAWRGPGEHLPHTRPRCHGCNGCVSCCCRHTPMFQPWKQRCSAFAWRPACLHRPHLQDTCWCRRQVCCKPAVFGRQASRQHTRCSCRHPHTRHMTTPPDGSPRGHSGWGGHRVTPPPAAASSWHPTRSTLEAHPTTCVGGNPLLGYSHQLRGPLVPPEPA